MGHNKLSKIIVPTPELPSPFKRDSADSYATEANPAVQSAPAIDGAGQHAAIQTTLVAARGMATSISSVYCSPTAYIEFPAQKSIILEQMFPPLGTPDGVYVSMDDGSMEQQGQQASTHKNEKISVE